MRIGEILRNDGVLTSWQLEAALRMQTQYGGRLVSNAIELGYLEADVAARALGRQMKVPAALDKHFAAIEPHAVARFSPKIAEKYQAIPLGYSSKQARTIIVSFVDPTQLADVDAIQFLVGARVLASVAPQIVITRALERHYGIAPKRQHDFVRLAGLAAGQDDGDFETTKHSQQPPALTPHASYRPSQSHADLTAPVSEPSSGRERRTLSPMSLPPVAAMPQEASDRPVPPSGPPPDDGRLGRSQVDTNPEKNAPIVSTRRVQDTAASSPTAKRNEIQPTPEARATRPTAIPARESRVPPRGNDPRADPPEDSRMTNPERPATHPPSRGDAATGWSMPPRMPPPPEPVGRPALSAGEAIEVIRRASSRERIGVAVVDYLRSSFGCGALLVTRNDIALGWKGFPAGVDDAGAGPALIEALALPLTQPSILALAYETRSTFRGAPPRVGDAIHARLYHALSTPPPREAVVAPIVVHDHAVTLVYAQAFDLGVLSGAVLQDLALVCAAASEAYLRLVEGAREPSAH